MICDDIQSGNIGNVVMQLVPDESIDRRNCPATAGALFNYAVTGVIQPLPSVIADEYQISAAWTAASWADILGAAATGPVVVRAMRSANVSGHPHEHRMSDGRQMSTQHYFVVLKCGATIWAADAFRGDVMEGGYMLHADQSQGWRLRNEFQSYAYARRYVATPVIAP